MKKTKKYFKGISQILFLSMILSMLSYFPTLITAEHLSTIDHSEWQPTQETGIIQNTTGDLSLEELKNKVLNESDKPEAIREDVIAEMQHVNRLWEQETDLNTIMFQNRDGQKTMYYYGVPVKYNDENGITKDKSNHVIEVKNKAKHTGYKYQNKANDILTLFPEIINQNNGVVLEKSGTKIELKPFNYIDGENSNINMRESAARKEEYANADNRSTDAVIYDNVFGDKTKLRYTPTFMGIKEDIVLEQYTGTNQFCFIISTNGLKLIKEDDGNIYIVDPLTGNKKVNMTSVYVYDSSIIQEKNSTCNNNIKIEELVKDNEYRVTIYVDSEFLTDTKTVYPVYVDPSFDILTAGSGTNKTIMDAPIYSGRPTTAHGGNPYNVIGNLGSPYAVGRTLVKFPGLMNNAAFIALFPAQITSVNYFIRENRGVSSPTASIDAYIFTGGNWTESTVTCSTFNWNSYTCLLDTEDFANSNGSWGDFNITYVVKAWKAGTYNWNTGIILKNQNESSTSYYRSFASTDFGSTLPYVTVTYRAFSATVNNYYDEGYVTRDFYNPTGHISSYLDCSKDAFHQVFNINIGNNIPQSITSIADNCPTNGNNINNRCTCLAPLFTCDHDTAYYHCKNGWALATKIVDIVTIPAKTFPITWTGHIACGGDCIGNYPQSDFGAGCAGKWAIALSIIQSSQALRDLNSKMGAMHELAHCFGADDNDYKNGETCDDEDHCIISYNHDMDDMIQYHPYSDWFCTKHKNQIINYLISQNF